MKSTMLESSCGGVFAGAFVTSRSSCPNADANLGYGPAGFETEVQEIRPPIGISTPPVCDVGRIDHVDAMIAQRRDKPRHALGFYATDRQKTEQQTVAQC